MTIAPLQLNQSTVELFPVRNHNQGRSEDLRTEDDVIPEWERPFLMPKKAQEPERSLLPDKVDAVDMHKLRASTKRKNNRVKFWRRDHNVCNRSSRMRRGETSSEKQARLRVLRYSQQRDIAEHLAD